MTKSFFQVRAEAYTDMENRTQKLLSRSRDAYKQGDLPTMRKAHSLAMKQDTRTRAKYPDESTRSTMSGATKDYADREKKYGPGKVRDSVEIEGDVLTDGMLDFMSSTPAKPKSKLTLSAMRDISRREDMKKNMSKAIRSQNEPQNPLYRTVRAEENEIEETEHTNEEIVDEQMSARLRMARALQKAKEDRERSERAGQKLLEPNGKEVGEPKKEKVSENAAAQRAAIAIAKQKSGKYDKEGNRIKEDIVAEEKPGLYANIHAKRRRIAAGSGEHMRKPGSKGAPTAQAFKDAAKTVRENIDSNINEGIASLISRSIKRVTAVKPTPQEKADIRLNK